MHTDDISFEQLPDVTDFDPETLPDVPVGDRAPMEAYDE